MTKQQESNPGVGLDVGTMNIVSARQAGKNIVVSRIRDAFIDLESSAKKRLRLSNANYVEIDGQLIVLGDNALQMANLFKREIRRPLSRGVIAPGEIAAQQILSLLVHNVLKDPVVPDEHCYFSVPASPIDDPSQDTTYHTEIFKKIIAEHGYTPHPMNEAMAIIYSQCADTGFSGLSVSFGSGMVNVGMAYQTMEGMTFSLARGGDWIDTNSARAIGSTASRMCAIKEQGVDLVEPKTREEEALNVHVRSLIRYTLQHIASEFEKDQAFLPTPIPFIVSGGTSKAGGFLDVFKSEFKEIQDKGFPIKISTIRQAEDPLTAVAEGLLVLAGEEYVDE